LDTSELNWSEQIWKEINADVLKEVGKVRVAQKVFPTSTLESDPASIPNEVIDFTNVTMAEGDTMRLVEIYRDFSLTSTQVKQDAEQKGSCTSPRWLRKASRVENRAALMEATAAHDSIGAARRPSSCPGSNWLWSNHSA
jgi:hypothetical protein